MYVDVVAPLPPITLAHPVLPSDDCCHWIVPVFPLNVIVVPLPEHTAEVVAAAVPPILVAFTVTAAVLLYADAQTPFVTTDR